VALNNFCKYNLKRKKQQFGRYLQDQQFFSGNKKFPQEGSNILFPLAETINGKFLGKEYPNALTRNFLVRLEYKFNK
jgi:hypothetical protein